MGRQHVHTHGGGAVKESVHTIVGAWQILDLQGRPVEKSWCCSLGARAFHVSLWKQHPPPPAAAYLPYEGNLLCSEYVDLNGNSSFKTKTKKPFIVTSRLELDQIFEYHDVAKLTHKINQHSGEGVVSAYNFGGNDECLKTTKGACTFKSFPWWNLGTYLILCFKCEESLVM